MDTLDATPLSQTLVKETIRRHWEGRAATFDQAPHHGLHDDDQRAAWLARVQAWAGPEPLDALDVGCGTGFLALLLAQLGHRAVGVDTSASMLERARAKAVAAGLAIELHLADAEQLPFEDASFDLVVERHVLWTMPDPPATLAEWRRVLRPGGRLVLVEGAWSGSAQPDYVPIQAALPLYHGRSSAQLTAVVTASGLVDPRVEPLLDATLWGSTPAQERYALLAHKPA